MTASMRERFAAEPYAPARARRLLRGWLRRLGWPGDQVEDLVLATNEAVSNAVEHAYRDGQRGEVDVHAEPIGDPSGLHRVLVTVVDTGAWRDPLPGRQEPWRGLRLIRATVSAIDVRGTAAGTRLKMISRPVRPGG
jgi:serine/threonine-protein kinase RsbW